MRRLMLGLEFDRCTECIDMTRYKNLLKFVAARFLEVTVYGGEEVHSSRMAFIE